MTDGIYIVGNDRYGAEVRALTNSIRHFDPSANICLIPYDDDSTDIADWVADRHGAASFPDVSLLHRITEALDAWFDYPGAPAQRDKRNRLRNLAAWCGPFDRFICLDADILVFEPIVRWCSLLDNCDFLVCDDMHRHGGKWVFTPSIKTAVPGLPIEQVFNGGFWVSKRDLMSERQLFASLAECARYREHFDFASGALAQPFINYVILSRTGKIRNLVKEDPDIRVWVGDRNLHERNRVVWHGRRRCPFLHWAGKPLEPGKFFHETWRFYHDLVS